MLTQPPPPTARFNLSASILVKSVRKKSRSRCPTADSAVQISRCSITNGACHNFRSYLDLRLLEQLSHWVKPREGSRLDNASGLAGRLTVAWRATNAFPAINTFAPRLRAPL